MFFAPGDGTTEIAVMQAITYKKTLTRGVQVSVAKSLDQIIETFNSNYYSYSLTVEHMLNCTSLRTVF